MNSISVSSDSVIKLILQFLLENGFEETFFSLQAESNVYLNGIENLDDIKKKVLSGSWGDLLSLLKYFNLPVNLLILIFEHILLELLELKEPFLAQLLLNNSEPLNKHLKFLNPQRYEHFSEAIERSIEIIKSTESSDTKECDYSPIKNFVKSNYIEDGDMINSRKRISSLLLEYIDELPPFKLLEVIGIALKSIKQTNKDDIINFAKYNGCIDIFNLGERPTSMPINENRKGAAEANIQNYKLTSNELIHKTDVDDIGEIKCITFSPDGEKLIIGTSKGCIFIGNCFENIFEKTNINSTFYFHSKNEKSILCLSTIKLKNCKLLDLSISIEELEKNFLVASTTENIDIKIWSSLSSSFVIVMENVHENYITDFRFNRDGTCILSGSYDGSMKIHGLKSERTIKYFPSNNKSFVKKVSYNSSEKIVIGGLNNGCLSIWDIKTSKCLAVYSICSSPIIELGLLTNSELVFSGSNNINTSNTIQTLDNICVVSKFQVFILNISNGEKTYLISNDCERKSIISASIEDKTNTLFIIDQSGIKSFDILKKTYNSNKPIHINNFENSRVKVNHKLGIIAIENKYSIRIIHLSFILPT